MRTVVYTDDFESGVHLSKTLHVSLEWIEQISSLLDIYDAIVILVLSHDIRNNETLLTQMVKQNNKILLLQRVPSLESAKFYLSLGVRGYGNAMMHRVYFDAALETIHSNLIWLHPEFTARLVGEVVSSSNRDFMERLSEREQEIATFLLEGKTNQDIADILHITPRTVKAHASHLYHKLQVKDRLDFAIRYK